MGPASSEAGRPLWLALPRWFGPATAAVSVALLCVGLAAPALLDDEHGVQAARLRRVTGFENPHGVPVWWTTVLFLTVAVMAYTLSVTQRPLGRSVGRRWGALSVVFAWLAFDHAVHVHVAASRLVAELGMPGWLDPLGLVLGTALLAAAIPLARAYGGRTQLGLLAAGLLLAIGGWGVDAVVGLGDREPSLSSLALETAAEWAGLVSLSYLLSGLMAAGETGGALLDQAVAMSPGTPPDRFGADPSDG
jgi:hypothetical protein